MEKIINSFGKTKDGKEALLYTLTNNKGMTAKISNYGAAIVSIIVPASDNTMTDVVLGYDNVSGYDGENPSCIGCVIGRNANRIGNASFNLNGKKYKLDVNDNSNNLHSSLSNGYHKRIWDTVSYSENSLTLRIDSKDLDQGFPGKLTMLITYFVTDDNELSIKYDAVSDKKTPWNPTNHSYFNLSGHNSGSIDDTILWIDADAFTVLDEQSIATGEIRSVQNTPMDFNTPVSIGSRIHDDYLPLKLAKGYDHNYCLNLEKGELKLISRAYSPKTNIVMETYTDRPGVQLYTGNYLSGCIGKENSVYEDRSGFCLETQEYPNSLNIESFPSEIINPGVVYTTNTIFKFSTK